MPTESLWNGVSASIEHASGNIVAVLLFIVAMLFVIFKYYLPERRQDRADKRRMEQQRFELEAKTQQDSIELRKADLESRARQLEILLNLSEQTKTLSSHTIAMESNQAVLISQMADSRSHTKDIVDGICDIKFGIDGMRAKVEDMHDVMMVKCPLEQKKHRGEDKDE